MHTKLFMATAALVVSTTSLAQADPDVSYDGNWSATVTADDGTRQVSRLVLKNFAGTWYGPTSRSRAACKSTKSPVTVQDSNGNALNFTVWGKTGGSGCGDLTVVLKPVSEKEFEGTVASVGTIRLVRR